MTYQGSDGRALGIVVTATVVIVLGAAFTGIGMSFAQAAPDDGPVSCSPGPDPRGCDDTLPPVVYTPSTPQVTPSNCGTPPAADYNYVMQVYEVARVSYEEYRAAASQLAPNDPRLRPLYDQYVQNMHMFECVKYFAGQSGPRPER
jgi:hypothetical protein